MDVNQATELYIKKRDEKAELKKAYEESVAEIDALLKKIEAVFLDQFNKTGQTAAKSKAGTVFVAERVSDKVFDRDAYLEFVKSNGAYEFLESRVNKTALDQYIEEHNDLPPGVTRTSSAVIRVRRS